VSDTKVRRWGGEMRSPESIDKFRKVSRARQRALRVIARQYAAEFAATWTDRGGKWSVGYDARRDAAERAVAANHPEEFALAFAAEKRREGIA
jgi:hypothetical protein